MSVLSLQIISDTNKKNTAQAKTKLALDKGDRTCAKTKSAYRIHLDKGKTRNVKNKKTGKRPPFQEAQTDEPVIVAE